MSRACRLVGAGIAVLVLTAPAAAQVRFEERLEDLAIAHVYGGDLDFVVGGGVAAFDCNEDLLPELFLAGGAHPARLLINTSQPGGPISVTEADWGEVDEALLQRVTGAYPIDVDNDGVQDLFVLRFGRNLLLRGLGDCRFEDATASFGLPEVEDWTTAFAAIWEPGQSLPTLAVGNYVDRSRPLDQTGNCDGSYLLRPEGDGYGAPIAFPASHCPLSLLFVDWTGQGRFDLRAANDRQYYDPEGQEQLFRLTEAGLQEYTAEEGWPDVQIWGMGLAMHDVTGDGLPDLAVTNMVSNRLEVLAGNPADGPVFEDTAPAAGSEAHRPYTGGDVHPSTAWHTEFADLDNDGMADLVIVKGNVHEMPEFAQYDPDNLLLRAADGHFVEAGEGSGVDIDRRGRGGALADLNLDGCLDMVVVNREQPASLFENTACSALGTAALLDLHQDGANHAAIGARIAVSRDGAEEVYFTAIGGGHAGGTAGPLHIGLGDSDSAAVSITWPDGSVTGPHTLDAGAVHRASRDGEGGVTLSVLSPLAAGP